MQSRGWPQSPYKISTAAQPNSHSVTPSKKRWRRNRRRRFAKCGTKPPENQLPDTVGSAPFGWLLTILAPGFLRSNRTGSLEDGVPSMLNWAEGPVAQRLEQQTHKRLVFNTLAVFSTRWATRATRVLGFKNEGQGTLFLIGHLGGNSIGH